jgi:hypothetical protein
MLHLEIKVDDIEAAVAHAVWHVFRITVSAAS